MSKKILILLSVLILSCESKEIKWDAVKNISISNNMFDDLPKLEEIEYTKLQKEIVIPILRKSKRIKRMFLWKGYRIVKIEFENNSTYLKMSNYGGVYYDLTNKKLFKINDENLSSLHKDLKNK